MPTTYATKEAAKKLDVSPNTLRNWSEQYSAFLSESARPGAQPERRFTDKDITVLTYVRQKIRAEGMEKTQILERLKETEFQDVEVLEPEATTLQTPYNTIEATTSITPIAPQTSLAMQEASNATETTSALAAYIDAMQTLQRRVEAVEASTLATEHNQRDPIYYMAVGAIGALVFVVLLLLLFLVRHWL